ncbi:MAG: response regulator transcription factor [Pedosphaera sp.]|nr:response regulator transcription factor [Pedosphaera sp.]
MLAEQQSKAFQGVLLLTSIVIYEDGIFEFSYSILSASECLKKWNLPADERIKQGWVCSAPRECLKQVRPNWVYMGDTNNRVPNVRTSSFIVEDEWKLVTIFEDEERILRALWAGATVFLVRAGDLNHLAEFFGDERDSRTTMPAIEFKTLRHFHLTRVFSTEIECLSPREKEVLELLARGFFYREIIKKLNIGMETVRTHVKHIVSKMHARNRIEAVVRYKANHMGNPPPGRSVQAQP